MITRGQPCEEPVQRPWGRAYLRDREVRRVGNPVEAVMGEEVARVGGTCWMRYWLWSGNKASRRQITLCVRSREQASELK